MGEDSKRGVPARALDAAALGLAAVLGVLHARHWSRFPPDVDPINLVAALTRYDVAADSPHPPGYPLYVLGAHAAATLVGPARAYQALNLALLLGAAAMLYLGLRRLGLPVVALLASAIFAFHPLALAGTVIQETYIVDAFFACAVFLVGATLGGRAAAYPLAVGGVMLALSLVRPVSCAMLLPLAVAMPAVVRARAAPGGASVRTAVGDLVSGPAVATAAIGVLAAALGWLATAQLVGGVAAYRAQADRVMGHAVREASVLAGASPEAHAAMLTKLAVWFAVLAAPAATAVAAAVAFRWRGPGSRPLWLAVLAAAWIGPALAFYAVVYYLKPTYQLIYLPVLCALLAWGLSVVTPRLALLAGGVLIAAQVGFFAAGPRDLPTPLYRLTAGYTAARDAAWEQLRAGLAGAPREGSLLVWDDPPNLSVQGVKLLDWAGRFAILDRAARELRYVSHGPMTWHDDPSPGVVPPEYARLVWVGGDGGRVAVRVVVLPADPGAEGRRVDRLAQAVR